MNLPTLLTVSGVLINTRNAFPIGSGNKYANPNKKNPWASKKLAGLRQKFPYTYWDHATRAQIANSYIGPPRNTINQLRYQGMLPANQNTYEGMIRAFDNYPAGNCTD